MSAVPIYGTCSGPRRAFAPPHWLGVGAVEKVDTTLDKQPFSAVFVTKQENAMTYDRAEIALSRARRDYHRAVNALFLAESEAARKRHSRAAQVASERIRRARYDLAKLGCDLQEVTKAA
jgi:hypothetical protein